MAIISFEKLAGNNQVEEVPDGFRRLNWDNFFAIDAVELEEGLGNTNAIRSGEAAAFGGIEGGRPPSDLLIGTMISISTTATSPRTTQTI